MNNLTLRACQGVLQITVPDATRHIGRCDQRMWRYYESGERVFPDVLVTRIRAVLERHAQVYNEICAQADEHKSADSGLLVVSFSVRLEVFKKETGLDDFLEYAAQMSAKAELCAQGKILPF